MLVSSYQNRSFSSLTDPHGTLLRDGMWTKDNASQSMQPLDEKQVFRLKELIDQQKKHIQTLKDALTDVQRRFFTVRIFTGRTNLDFPREILVE